MKEIIKGRGNFAVNGISLPHSIMDVVEDIIEMIRVESEIQSLRNRDIIDFIRQGFGVKVSDRRRRGYLARMVARKVIIGKFGPVAVFPGDNFPLIFSPDLADVLPPAGRMAVEADEDAVETVDFSQIEQSLCK